MRILLDTNILILRENNHIIPSIVARLMSLLNGLDNCSLHVHPLSISEIKKDGNIQRREVNLSKVSSYAVLPSYPNYMESEEFVSKIGNAKNSNDIIDNQLLFCVYLNAVDYLITEDQELLNKADLLGLENVVNINEAIAVFEQFYPRTDINLIQSFNVSKISSCKLKLYAFSTIKL